MKMIFRKISFFITLICGVISIEDNEINFMVKDENDSILKFKYVLIAFDRIAFSMSTWLERKFVLIPSEEKIVKIDDFTQLQNIAIKLTNKYETILSKKENYYEKAYNYRFLQWFKFSMRRGNVINVPLEEKIDKLLQDYNSNWFDPLHPLELRKSSFSPNFDSFAPVVSYESDIENKCANIENMDQLRNFGQLQDGIVGFCILLGLQETKLAENIEFEMPFYRQIDDYEKLLHDKIEYLCDLAKLYFHALKHLLYVTLNFEVEYRFNNEIHRIENFVLDMKKIDRMRTSKSEKYATETDKLNVLENMMAGVISTYHNSIKNFVHSNMYVTLTKELSDQFKRKYSKLLKWMASHTRQISGENGSLYPKLITMIAGASSVAGDESSDEVYLAITTYEDLTTFSSSIN